MELTQIGDTEYNLIIEEKIRECIPANYGVGVTRDRKYRFPAIILREPLKDKILYNNPGMVTKWEATHFRDTGIDKVFLCMNFGDRSLKFYINLYDQNFVNLKELWFSLIIETNGMIAISDKIEPLIFATNVPIDIPKLILGDENMREKRNKK